MTWPKIRAKCQANEMPAAAIMAGQFKSWERSIIVWSSAPEEWANHLSCRLEYLNGSPNWRLHTGLRRKLRPAHNWGGGVGGTGVARRVEDPWSLILNQQLTWRLRKECFSFYISFLFDFSGRLWYWRAYAAINDPIGEIGEEFRRGL